MALPSTPTGRKVLGSLGFSALATTSGGFAFTVREQDSHSLPPSR